MFFQVTKVEGINQAQEKISPRKERSLIQQTKNDPEKAKQQKALKDRKTTSDETSKSPRKKSGHKVEFKLNSEEETSESSKITILEPHEIIALLRLLEKNNPESHELLGALKTPIQLIKNEMAIEEEAKLEEV